MGRLDGKVALISGGARGQGATEGRMFVREGAAVVLGDVLDDEGKKVEAEIRANGGKATYVHLDVTREADWRAAVATAVQAYGKLNVLVNNAGILFRALSHSSCFTTLWVAMRSPLPEPVSRRSGLTLSARRYSAVVPPSMTSSLPVT